VSESAPVPPPRASAGRFQSALAWNIGSLAVLGVSGIALNALIGALYDASALGVFNQALAAYIFFSQAAVGGLDRSVLKEVAASSEERARRAAILAAALVPGLALAALATLGFWFARGPIGAWLESPGTAEGIAWATPGLFFFALNKLLLAAVNGLSRMRAFAVYQSLRYLLILTALGGFALLDRERAHAAHLAGVFSFAEGVLFLVLAIEIWLQLGGPLERGWRARIRPHLSYGLRSVGSGVLLELNARVDVLMIGWFLSDADVGVYTFAAMIVEGLYQLLVVLQNLYNPILARELAARRLAELHATIQRGKRRTYLGMAVVAALALWLFPVALALLTDKPAFAASELPFRWLMLGIVLCAGYIPFAQTLLMAGFPGTHTLYMVLTVLINVVGNAILTPRLGLAGAAIATSISMFLGVFVLRGFVRARTGLRL
jgi:O-antigen/teichoic acid export membrane protein